MSRLETALNGGIDPARTRKLLQEEWHRLGGTDDQLNEICEDTRTRRRALDPTETKRVRQVPWQSETWLSLRNLERTKAPTVVSRLVGVGAAIAHIDSFVTIDRPCIREASELTEIKKGLSALHRRYRALQPDDRKIGRAFQILQELFFERSANVGVSPTAIYLLLSRPGPSIAHLVRFVIAPLYLNGYDWSEIADLVDDSGARLGREERLRKLHESDPTLALMKSLESRGAADSGGKRVGEV